MGKSQKQLREERIAELEEQVQNLLDTIFCMQLRYEPNNVRKAVQDSLAVVEETFVQSFPKTTVQLVAEYNGHRYVEQVTVVRFWKDAWNAQAGRDIARSRAKANIAKRVLDHMRKERLGCNDKNQTS